MFRVLTHIIWWLGIALVSLLLARGWWSGVFRRYPIFYFYLAHVLILSLFRVYFYFFRPDAYQMFYWDTQFLSVAVGYCVLWEIYRQALADYPGADRMARQVLLAVFIFILAKFFVDIVQDITWSQAETALERNFRAAQAALLGAIFGLFAYYGIPIGRNLKGIIFGYGFFVGTSVINLTLRSYIGEAFQAWWQYLQPLAWDFTLLVWSAALWAYHANPKPEREIAIERDYQLLSAYTAQALAKARSYIVRAVQP